MPGAAAASDPSFQVQLQTRGRGRKAEGHSSAYSTPWGKFLRGHSREGFLQAVCPSQTGRRKGPREEGDRNSSSGESQAWGRSSILYILSPSMRPKVLGRIVTELTRGRGDAPYHPAMLRQKRPHSHLSCRAPQGDQRWQRAFSSRRPVGSRAYGFLKGVDEVL